jgi:hypothetical protein
VLLVLLLNNLMSAAGGGVLPTFVGPTISNVTVYRLVAMGSIDFSSRFTDDGAMTFAFVGTPPAGLSLSSAGVLSGTPTTLGATTGLSIRCTAGADTVDSNTFTITVINAPAPTNGNKRRNMFGGFNRRRG